MRVDRLSEETVRQEIDRLLSLDVLGYWKTIDGIEHHTVDKGTSHIYGIYHAMLRHLITDAEERGINPAYLLYYLNLGIWAQSDDAVRSQIEQFWTFDKAQGIAVERNGAVDGE